MSLTVQPFLFRSLSHRLRSLRILEPSLIRGCPCPPVLHQANQPSHHDGKGDEEDRDQHPLARLHNIDVTVDHIPVGLRSQRQRENGTEPRPWRPLVFCVVLPDLLASFGEGDGVAGRHVVEDEAVDEGGHGEEELEDAEDAEDGKDEGRGAEGRFLCGLWGEGR